MCSYFCKEQAVILSINLFLIYIAERGFSRNIKDYINLLPLFILSIICGLFSYWIQYIGFEHKLTEEYYPFYQRFILANYSLSRYFFISIFPINLSVIYSFPIDPGESLPFKYLFYLSFGASFIYIINYLFKENLYFLLFFLAFFTINLFLSMHLIPMSRGIIISHRYLYVSLIGLIVIVFYFIFQLKARKNWIGSIYIIYLFVYSYFIIEVYNP